MSQKEYNKMHKMFDKNNTAFMNHGIVPVITEVKESFEHFVNQANFYVFLLNQTDINGLSVLDIGCGRGGGLSAYKKLYPSSNLFGCDINKKAIKFAKSQNPNIDFQVCSYDNLKYSKDFFDVVVSLESSHLYGQPHLLFDEVFRVLKPGGKFFYADAGEVVNTINEHSSGLNVIEIKNITDQVADSCKEDINNFSSLPVSDSAKKFFVNLAINKFEVYSNKTNEYFYCIAEKPM